MDFIASNLNQSPHMCSHKTADWVCELGCWAPAQHSIVLQELNNNMNNDRYT